MSKSSRSTLGGDLQKRLQILPGVRPLISKLLEETSLEAQKALPTYAERAHKQGEMLAQWARDKFGLSVHAKANPEKILRELGVEIKL